MNTDPAPADPSSSLRAYNVGDKDERPWGHYLVTDVGRNTKGEEYCNKLIIVKPEQALSLQSHKLRHESWTVKKGILTAIRDGERVTLSVDDAIEIPRGSIHCMANLGEDDCIVEERQSGICREEDIRRYVDAYNRTTETADESASASISVYKAMLAEISLRNDARRKSASR
jgi:mannose-6-phosphate isomerase-like protein (cupin superfamily)